jgi:hypothetical protein
VSVLNVHPFVFSPYLLMPVRAAEMWITTSGTESNLNCSAVSGGWLKLGPSASSKEAYAILLAAYAMEVPIHASVIAGSQDCQIASVWMARS